MEPNTHLIELERVHWVFMDGVRLGWVGLGISRHGPILKPRARIHLKDDMTINIRPKPIHSGLGRTRLFVSETGFLMIVR